VASIIASGPQMKDLVHARSRQQRLDDRLDLVAVDATLQQIHLLCLAGEDVDQRQAVAIAVLEVLQGLVEHHARHAAVAVDQRELGFRLLFQRGRGDRQDGRDAGAGGEADAVDGALLPDREAAVRRHHLEPGAGLQGLRGPVGEQAARDRADADFQFAGPGQAAARAADRIGAAHVLAVDPGTQGQELAGLELEGIPLGGGNVEGDCHRAGGFGADALDGEFVKTEG
jgi:5-carboxymethyl-2-hydroxymuconate isomerase